MDGNEFARAMKEMEGKYVGNRPVQLRKSTWDERNPGGGGGGGSGGGGGKGKGKRKQGQQPGGFPPSKKKYHIPIVQPKK
jgi:hypothetical protein